MTATNSANWMSGIDATLSLNMLTIPGSHESGALYGEVASKCQDYGILRQLVRGIRFLDIRCKYVSDDDSSYFFPVHHGADWQHTDFSSVQNNCIEFLNSHPKEAIFMNVQQAESEEPSSVFSDKFNQLKQDEFWSLAGDPPALVHLQKHIQLIRTCRRNWSLTPMPAVGGWEWPVNAAPRQGKGLEWNGFAVSGESFNDLFQTQNFWHGIGGKADGNDPQYADIGVVKGGITGSEKGEWVEKYLHAASTGGYPGKLVLNFLSRADSRIRPAADDMNARIVTYFNNLGSAGAQNHAGFGILAMDYVGNTGKTDGCLEDLIIRRNALAAGASYSYSAHEAPPAGAFKIQFSSGGQTKGWMVEGQHSWCVLGANDPVVFERYDHNGVTYFKRQGHEQYLSASSEGQVGLYAWDGARTFQKESHWLFSDYYNGEPIRARPNGELWCDHKDLLLEVAFVPA